MKPLQLADRVQEFPPAAFLTRRGLAYAGDPGDAGDGQPEPLRVDGHPGGGEFSQRLIYGPAVAHLMSTQPRP